MHAESTTRRIHLWTALVLAAVFVAGAAAGAGLAVALRPLGPRPPPPHGRGGALPPPLSELGLSAEQDRKVRSIIESHRAELDAVVRETFPRLREIQDRTDGEIRAALSPDQARRFDALRAQRPPPPPGPALPPPP